MRQSNRPPTPEQVELVRWTASLGAVSAEALAHRRDLSVPSARARLAAAQRRGLLSHESPLTGRPTLFAATRTGLRLCHIRGIPTCTVSPHNATHLIACAAVAAALERGYLDHRLIGERELRRDEREHGRVLASAKLSGTHHVSGGLHRPDLVLWQGSREVDLPVVVEVELTTKAPRRLVEICRAWAHCRTVAGVLYVAPSEVERAVSRAIAEAHAAESIVVVPLGSLVGVEEALAR